MTPEEIKDEKERQQRIAEAKEAMAKAEAEARKPGWFEAPGTGVVARYHGVRIPLKLRN